MTEKGLSPHIEVDHFVINGLQHEVTDIVILHGLSYDVVAAQIGSQYKGSMCAV